MEWVGARGDSPSLTFDIYCRTNKMRFSWSYSYGEAIAILANRKAEGLCDSLVAPVVPKDQDAFLLEA